MSEQVTIRAWGNSQGIRLPKNILEKLDIGISDTLQINVENDAIILKKLLNIKPSRNVLQHSMEKYPFMILTGAILWVRRYYDLFFQGDILKISGFQSK